MAAKFIPIGEPAHDAERQALRFLVDGLPDRYTVYGNPWLVDRNGGIFELDAVVVASHAIFVVEIKSYRGRIDGTDHDWYIPHPIKSPIKLNRRTAQILKTQLKNESYQAGQVWVQGVVFLSATTDLAVKGPASDARIYTRKNILAALQDEALVERLSGRYSLTPSSAAESDLLKLLTGVRDGPRPVRRVREYEITDRLDVQESFIELAGKNTLSGAERVLRIYSIPPMASEAQRERIVERARWEAQVLGRLGRTEGILSADPPFADEAGIVLPLEHFRGITLTTWLGRYGPEAKGKTKADLKQRTDLWMRIAQILEEAHRQGVVHRLLRPEVILVEDKPDPDQLRVTGFDLAKQLAVDTTISFTTVADERLAFAAPEVVSAFSSAEPASDQFSLGALLGLLLTGTPLFENTRQLMQARRLLVRVRDKAPRVPLTLDEAVSKMLELRPTDRYRTLAEAIEVVRAGREPGPRQFSMQALEKGPLDADNLAAGTRIGSDYEILSRLGQGGMAVVYAARHLVSGKTRALKIARPEEAAEEALRGEYQVLSGLDHANVVRVLDISKMIEGRLTLVMERVGGETLRQWLAKTKKLDAATQRRLAENLLAGLDYLEQQGVTHKDLKPDNLLIGDAGLTIIDFSLAAMPEDAPYGGTALYRDPASARWSHASDRYAAALCLFELYAGRHAFEGRVPEPGQGPSVQQDDIEPPGLAAFFQKALNPSPEARFPSGRAMREALLVALGEDVQDTGSIPTPELVDVTTPLRLSGLSNRAVNALSRCRVQTVGELLALTENQIRSIHAIGTKTALDVISFQAAVKARGLEPSGRAAFQVDPPLVPALVDNPEPVEQLPLSAALRAALRDHDLPTVGAVARLTRAQLLDVPGIGKKKLSEVVESLHQFGAKSPEADGVHTLDKLWDRASRPLKDSERIAVERVVGILGEPEIQAEIAKDLRVSQPQVSNDCSHGLERLELPVLSELSAALETLLNFFGGVVRLDDLGARLEETWPAGVVSGVGIVRLLVRLSSARCQLVEVPGVEVPLVVDGRFDRETLTAFVAEIEKIGERWPPMEPDAARRQLTQILSHFDGDPLALAVRVSSNVRLSGSGYLFIPPIDAPHNFQFVLAQLRGPISLAELRARVEQEFGDGTSMPTVEYTLEHLRELDCRVEGEMVVPGRTGSVVAHAALPSDEPQVLFGNERTREEVVRDMLVDAASTRGFRMLVTPPERHAEIGRSVARLLRATWVSFDEAFFSEHGGEIASLERAERFVAQRDALTEAAEETLFRLLDEHGAHGNVVVLGDTSLFGLCDALDLPRRLYDETLSGSRGFWVLVVPGVIHNRQPLFNEGPPMWHLEGATLPLLRELTSTLPKPVGGPT